MKLRRIKIILNMVGFLIGGIMLILGTIKGFVLLTPIGLIILFLSTVKVDKVV